MRPGSETRGRIYFSIKQFHNFLDFLRENKVLEVYSIRGVAQSGSAPALGAGSRRFKSSRPDHINLILVNHLMVTLYVLKGKSGKRYVGMTNDLA